MTRYTTSHICFSTGCISSPSITTITLKVRNGKKINQSFQRGTDLFTAFCNLLHTVRMMLNILHSQITAPKNFKGKEEREVIYVSMQGVPPVLPPFRNIVVMYFKISWPGIAGAWLRGRNSSHLMHSGSGSEPGERIDRPKLKKDSIPFQCQRAVGLY